MAAAAAPLDCAEPLAQDLNCNFVDADEEWPIDASDPACAAQIDPVTGAPFPTSDWYFDYAGHGCEIPVAVYDLDGDGFGDGTVVYPAEAVYPDIVANLACDNCPEIANPDQLDADCDDLGDSCDNCVFVRNNAQGNADEDALGDDCDNCPGVTNPDQADGDLDAIGDGCDVCPFAPDPGQEDLDGDGAGDRCDSCLFDANPEQEDVDLDGLGDRCDRCPAHADPEERDDDGDGTPEVCDTCPGLPDPDQGDADFDGFGDVCDICPELPDGEQGDRDGDGWGDVCDVCPTLHETLQSDVDGDLAGDPCDVCPQVWDALQEDGDGDGFGDACDTCVDLPNLDQADSDGDGLGDACDPVLRGGGRLRGGCATAPLPGMLGLLLVLPLLRRRWLVAGAAVGCAEVAPPPEEAAAPAPAGGCTGGCPEACDNAVDDDVDGAVDCDDRDCAGQCPERCANGYDDDGDALEDLADPDCLDQDGDGALPDVDCDDADPGVGAPVHWLIDGDLDGFGDAATAEGDPACGPIEPTRVSGAAPDCDDRDAERHPTAREVCADGRDQDCDGVDPVCLAGTLSVADAAAVVSGSASRALVGASLARVPDLDGDGLPELLSGGTNAAWLFSSPHLGERSDADAVPLPVADGGTVLVVAAGDEVLVRSTSLATVWLLDPALLDLQAAVATLSIEAGTVSTGSVDADPYVDLLVGGAVGDPSARLLRGPFFGEIDGELAATAHFTAEGFGGSAVLVGDLDADGLGDAAMAADGEVVAFLAPMGGTRPTSGAEATWTGAPGATVQGEHDLDGDGRVELVIASVSEATTWVVSGLPQAPLPIGVVATASLAAPGVYAAAGVGDTDGDAAVELAASAPYLAGGTVWLFAGPVAGALDPDEAAAALSEEENGSAFGAALLPGDVNADGLSDLWIGSHTGDRLAVAGGSAFLFLGVRP